MASIDTSREFAFTTQDFEQVRRLIYDHAGIALSPSKRDMVYGRLARRLRALKLNSFADYLCCCNALKGGRSGGFVNALTTNLTSFFRESHHFDILRDYLAKRRQQGHKPSGAAHRRPTKNLIRLPSLPARRLTA